MPDCKFELLPSLKLSSHFLMTVVTNILVYIKGKLTYNSKRNMKSTFCMCRDIIFNCQIRSLVRIFK